MKSRKIDKYTDSYKSLKSHPLIHHDLKVIATDEGVLLQDLTDEVNSKFIEIKKRLNPKLNLLSIKSGSSLYRKELDKYRDDDYIEKQQNNIEEK